MTGRPKWQQEQVERLTRKLRWRDCPRCGQKIMEGLDADRAALLVQLDPEPVAGGDYTISQDEIAYRYRLPGSPPTEKQTWREHACRETETPLEETLW